MSAPFSAQALLSQLTALRSLTSSRVWDTNEHGVYALGHYMQQVHDALLLFAVFASEDSDVSPGACDLFARWDAWADHVHSYTEGGAGAGRPSSEAQAEAIDESLNDLRFHSNPSKDNWHPYKMFQNLLVVEGMLFDVRMKLCDAFKLDENWEEPRMMGDIVSNARKEVESLTLFGGGFYHEEKKLIKKECSMWLESRPAPIGPIRIATDEARRSLHLLKTAVLVLKQLIRKTEKREADSEMISFGLAALNECNFGGSNAMRSQGHRKSAFAVTDRRARAAELVAQLW